MLPEVIEWEKDSELENYSYEYWNNRTEECEKEWDISDGNTKKLMNYLNNAGLLKQYQLAEKILLEHNKDKDKLIICDLACGTGWTSAFFQKSLL